MTARTGKTTKTVADVMSADVLTVDEELSLEELATFLLNHEITGAPVVNQDEELVGVVSLADVARSQVEQGGVDTDLSYQPDYFDRSWGVDLAPEEMRWLRVTGNGRTVGDVMSTKIYSVSEETPIQEAAQTLLRAHVHRLLVLRDGRLVGIVSTSDLLELLA
jgi:CBS domain-containing protein